jgi:uroporphyrinogen III methyltransferase / synthase
VNPPDLTEPLVSLVGAGPGDPGLLTLRAVELLSKADLILYDQLVPLRLLDFANPNAEAVCIRDLPAQQTDKSAALYNRIIAAAQQGLRVVRLKGGDPLVFGRGGEEAEVLRQSGLAYEIVPGVTAALATAAFLDIPLTHRGHTSAVAFITGHELPSRPNTRLDWNALALFPGTLAIYMGIARLPVICAELIRNGKDPNTPAVICERASTGAMRSVSATLADLEAVRRAAGLEAPGLILIGDATRHRPTRSWFERRPLFGRRVLVTRARQQAEPMVRRLEQLGAVPFQLPTIEIREPVNLAPLDAAIQALQTADGGFDWLVFSSANGVQAVMTRLKQLGRDLRVFGRVRFAAVGPKTADALNEYHLNADIVPAKAFNAEGLAEALREAVRGQRVLLPRANLGRDLLPIELGKIASVTQVTAYDQVDAVDTASEAFASLRRGEIEFVSLSSSNIARTLLSVFDETLRGRVERGEVKLVCISQETGRTVRDLSFRVAAEAEVSTTDGLIAAIQKLAASDSTSDPSAN